MTLVIKKEMSKEEIENALKQFSQSRPKRRGFNAKKYTGKVKFLGDPVKIQRKLRDEWK